MEARRWIVAALGLIARAPRRSRRQEPDTRWAASKSDSHDNALAESVIGLFRTEVSRQRGPWRGLDDVEFAPPAGVWQFNHHRLLDPLGYVPVVEYGEAFYRHRETRDLVPAPTR